MLHKTNWFKNKVEKHGLVAYFLLYGAIGFIGVVALETGYILYWSASLSNFASLYVALMLYYLMSFGSLILAFWIGIESYAKYGKWYLSWALVIVILGISRVVIPLAVDQLPRKIDQYFDTLQSERKGIGEPRDWI